MSWGATSLRGASNTVRLVDRVLTAVFGRHANAPRHEHDRLAHRGANVPVSFRTYLAWLYGAAWVTGIGVAVVVLVVTDTLLGTVIAGVGSRVGTVWVGCRYLHWRATARQRALEQTLPAAVRHLRILSTGEMADRKMLSQIADTPQLYAETAVAFRRVLNRAQLAGSLTNGLRETANETPSEVFSSLLLRLQAAIGNGDQAVTEHLELKARILKDHQRRGRARRTSRAELISEIVVVVLAVPAAAAILVTMGGVFFSGMHSPVETPAGTASIAVVLVYCCVIGVVVVGIAATTALGSLLRPVHRSTVTLPRSIGQLVNTALRAPGSTAVVLAPIALGISWGLLTVGIDGPTAVLYGYALFAIPTGLVGLRHDQRTLTLNRELREFVHGLAAVTGRGRSFSDAVTEVSTEYSLGRLTPAVTTSAFDLRVSTQSDARVREAALSKFAANVGTPIAHRLAVILTGALRAGCQTPRLFELLEEDLDQVYHELRAQRTMLRGYVAVVWATALGTTGILAAIGVYVLPGIVQLEAVIPTPGAMPSQPTPAGVSGYQLYLLAAANAVACGWVAWALSGTRGGVFLHSGVLALIVFMGFRGLGLG